MDQPKWLDAAWRESSARLEMDQPSWFDADLSALSARLEPLDCDWTTREFVKIGSFTPLEMLLMATDKLQHVRYLVVEEDAMPDIKFEVLSILEDGSCSKLTSLLNFSTFCFWGQKVDHEWILDESG